MIINYFVTDNKLKNTKNIKIYIEQKNLLTFNDLITIIENNITLTFYEIYDSEILNKSLSFGEYKKIIERMLKKIDTLEIIVNNEKMFHPIVNNQMIFDLAYHVTQMTF